MREGKRERERESERGKEGEGEGERGKEPIRNLSTPAAIDFKEYM